MNDKKQNAFTYNLEYRKHLKFNAVDNNQLKIFPIMQAASPVPDQFSEIAASIYTMIRIVADLYFLSYTQ